MGVLKQYFAAWAAFASILKLVIGRLCETLLKERTGRNFQPACCITPPNTVRARTDPYIYSQSWLYSRGLAVTWDNPDFTLQEVATGLVVRGDIVKPDTQYRIDVHVHNHSRMAAIATQVVLQWHRFGVALPATAIGQGTADIPPVGDSVVSFDWTTPADASHICLDAFLWQADDANPLNNVGQHNVFVVGPLETAGRAPFSVGNLARDPRTYAISLDGYRLPEAPLRPPPGGKVERTPPRSGLDYLRALQAANDPRNFPAPAALAARVNNVTPRVEPGESVELVVEFDPAAAIERTPINVNIFHEGRLMGGVTIYNRR